MAKNGFQVGDVVRLKSGGPDMTVGSIGHTTMKSQNAVQCQWFGGRKLEQGYFAPETLVLASEVKDKDDAHAG